MSNRLKTSLFTFMAGAVMGFAAAGYFFSASADEAPADAVSVNQVSGAKISHSGFSFKGKALSFTTRAEGEGEAVTSIRKDAVPEARDWMRRVHGVGGSVTVLYDSGFYNLYSLSYWRRFESVAVGCHLSGSGRSAGVGFGAMYWF